MKKIFVRHCFCLHKQFIALTFLLLPLVSFAQTALKVEKVSITVSNLEKAIDFYKNVLTFQVENQFEIKDKAIATLFGLSEKDLTLKIALLKLGEEQIELIEFVNEKISRPIPADSRSTDLWFQHIAIVVNDMPKAYQLLRKNKVQHVSTAPQTLPDYLPAAAGISAFYFRDTDGHNLELIYFPKEKGNPKWQNASNKIFLGIDHTAIGIQDTDKSLDFYQNKMGLAVAGNSENYGSEQEHLNQVFGAHLLITGLKAKTGFGVEFLNYIAPPGGRPYPEDSKATDLWHWHTTIQVDNADKYFEMLKKSGVKIISKQVVNLTQTAWKYKKAFAIRDLDGHCILVVEAP